VRELRAAELELAPNAGTDGAGGDQLVVGAGLTPFEKLSALALVVFRAARVRWLVLETGMGGRWDCTNHVVADRLPRSMLEPSALPDGGRAASARAQPAEGGAVIAPSTWPTPVAAEEAPAAAVGICRVGLDHINVLGGTLELIGGEKAGILKRRVPAFAAPQPAEVMAVLHRVAAERGATLAFPALDDPDMRRALELAAGVAAREQRASEPSTVSGTAFFPHWLRPAHQQHNLSLAIALVRALLSQAAQSQSQSQSPQSQSPQPQSPQPRSDANAAAPAWQPPWARDVPAWSQPAVDRALRAALATRWPGRLEVVRLGDVRSCLLDVAHNEDALGALLRHLDDEGWGPAPLTVAFGANRDKDVRVLLRMLGHFALRHTAPRAAERQGSAGAADAAGEVTVPSLQLVASAHPKAFEPAALLVIARAEVPDAPWTIVDSVAAAVDCATGLAAEHERAADGPGAFARGETNARVTLFVGSVSVVAAARERLAQTRAAALPDDDWAFEGLAEAELGLLAAAQ